MTRAQAGNGGERKNERSLLFLMISSDVSHGGYDQENSRFDARVLMLR